MPYHDNVLDTDNKTIHDNNNVTGSQPAKNIIITFTIAVLQASALSRKISHIFSTHFRDLMRTKTNI